MIDSEKKTKMQKCPICGEVEDEGWGNDLYQHLKYEHDGEEKTDKIMDLEQKLERIQQFCEKEVTLTSNISPNYEVIEFWNQGYISAMKRVLECLKRERSNQK